VSEGNGRISSSSLKIHLKRGDAGKFGECCMAAGEASTQRRAHGGRVRWWRGERGQGARHLEGSH